MSSSNRDANQGPWPEPDGPQGAAGAADLQAEAERLGVDAARIADRLDDAGDRVGDQLDDVDDHVAAWDERTEAKGSKGVALAVAGLNVGFFMILPVLLVVCIYTFITIYAIVKAVGSGSNVANPVVILLGVVGVVTLAMLLLGAGGWLIGRAADPRKRR